MNFHIRRLNKHTFDCFEGKQWSTWTRLKEGKNGVYVSAGERLPHPVLKALTKAIDARLPVQDVTCE